MTPRSGRSPDNKWTVRTVTDVDAILESRKAMGPSSQTRVLVRVPGMPRAEATAWEGELENFRSDCGCRAGAIAMGIFGATLVAYSAWDNLPAPLSAASILLRTSLGLAGLILSAVIGKLVGLHRAAISFERTCSQLLERIHSGPVEDGGALYAAFARVAAKSAIPDRGCGC
jgi:hypothetical protein